MSEEPNNEYRAHQAELRRFIDDTQRAVDQADHGKAEPLDPSAIKTELRKRLADQGIVDGAASQRDEC